jgi:hypothetical protein
VKRKPAQTTLPLFCRTHLVGFDAMTSGSKYTSIEIYERPCEGETFAPDGYPEKCKNARVFELTHASGRTLHRCEYHTECNWNSWPTFRNAIRDLWPVRLQSKSFHELTFLRGAFLIAFAVFLRPSTRSCCGRDVFGFVHPNLNCRRI